MCIEDVKTKIKQRRRQVLVHSYIYYVMNDNIISDDTWSKWAEELEQLQKDYPAESAEVEMYDEFKNFDHSTGANLVYDTPSTAWVQGKALQLIRYEYERGNKK